MATRTNHLIVIAGFDSLSIESNNLSAVDILNSVLGFCNSFRALKAWNKVCVILALPNRCEYLYVPEDSLEPIGSRERGKRAVGAGTGCVEELRTMNDVAIDRAKVLLNEHLLATSVQSGRANPVNASCSLSGPITKALCYASKRERRAKRGAELEAENDAAASGDGGLHTFRILFFKVIGSLATVKSSGEYLSLMNVAFSAQQRGVPIDACLLLQPTSNLAPASSSDITLCQQAADLSNGQFVTLWLTDEANAVDNERQRADEHKGAFAVTDANSLFQYLVFYFLPSVEIRSRFRSAALAKPDAMRTVDYRAACVCHSRLIDVGFVCSACLSVYCVFTPLCAVCESHFSLQNNNAAPVPRTAALA